MKTLIMAAVFVLGASQVALAQADTGLIDSKGYEVPTQSIDPPAKDSLDGFLQKLSFSEMAWSDILNKVFDPKSGVLFLSADADRCLIKGVTPFREVKVYFNSTSKTLTFCPAFFVAPAPEQTLLYLQELSRFAFVFIGNEHHDGTDSIIGLLGGVYDRLLKAGSFATYKTTIMELRRYLDRYAPRLLNFASGDRIVGEFDIVYVFADTHSSVAYPVPRDINDPQFISQHFYDFFAGRLWISKIAFSSSDMSGQAVRCITGNPGNTNHAVCSMQFTYFDGAKTITSVSADSENRMKLPHMTPPLCTHCGPRHIAVNEQRLGLFASSVAKSSLSIEFADYLTKTGTVFIRTVHARGDLFFTDSPFVDEYVSMSDVVYVFE